MTQSELNRYREILQRKQAELISLLSPTRRDEIAVGRSADPLDNVQRATEIEIAVEHFDRDSNALRSVTVALDRINDGTFGTCVRCEKAISPKRLAAVPCTPFCIKCQEEMDRLQDGTADDPAEFVPDAA